MTTRARGALTAVLGVVVAVLAVLLGPQVVGDGPSDGGGAPAARATSTPSSSPSSSTPATNAASGLPVVALADLPPEAAEVLDAVEAGGPFRYPGRDGSTFGNFEGRLPERPRGTYREYTVPTPGERDRGARRLVVEGEPPGPGSVVYWTDDHYDSFSVVQR